MDKIVKIVLAVLFFSCILDLPYGYFQLIRFIALVGFGVLAFQANQKGNNTEMLICIGLAILFQPFLKISLGRQLWNVVDVIVGIGLIASIFIKQKNRSN
jgi:energy-coupling factor transporter transmembrane protein EcfT